jgi:GNAT superfamily N-acetyltransferase
VSAADQHVAAEERDGVGPSFASLFFGSTRTPPFACTPTFRLMPRYEISTDFTRFDVDAIHAFLSVSYWSPGVPIETVRRAIENSVCVGAYLDGQQVGFARMVTDKATFAYLADVYVLEGHRGHGLSKQMLEALLHRPELQGLRRMMLVTRDAHSLYAKFGFKPLAVPERFMELHNPYAYASNTQSSIAQSDLPTRSD